MPTSAPASRALSSAVGVVDAAGDGQRGVDAAVQDGDPAQRQQQLGGRAQVPACGVVSMRLQVDVGLEEAVEQHQAVGARPRPAAWPCWPWR